VDSRLPVRAILWVQIIKMTHLLMSMPFLKSKIERLQSRIQKIEIEKAGVTFG